MPNLWYDSFGSVVMRNTLRKIDIAAGHGIKGTDHSDDLGTQGTMYWKMAVTMIMETPHSTILHHC